MPAGDFFGVPLTQEGSRESTPEQLGSVFELLRPRATRTPLIRIGGERDGSYLLPDDLAGITACFSPGVNRIKYFEDFLADEYGIASHMCDFSTDVAQLTTPLRPGLQTFAKKWLDPRPGEDNLALDDWVRQQDVSGDLLLQMDIEGAEYRNLLAVSDETLDRFRVIVIEVHGLAGMRRAAVLDGVVAPLFRRLASRFTTVHAHPNNCCADFAVPGSDVRIPDVLELTLVRSDRVVLAPGPVAVPHPLDVGRNVPANPPLFLGEAWCGGVRPVESRVKMLQDRLDFADDPEVAAPGSELPGSLSLMMQSLQTMAVHATPAVPARHLVEVAAGRPFELSSAYDQRARTGTVAPARGYFFHTGFGRDQWIRVDLGRRRRLRRIELTNRSSEQRRANHLFALLDDDVEGSTRQVFPVWHQPTVPGGGWQEASVDLPDVRARYVTLTSPMITALHLADLRVYAAEDLTSAPPRWRRVLGRVRRRTQELLRGRSPNGR